LKKVCSISLLKKANTVQSTGTWMGVLGPVDSNGVSRAVTNPENASTIVTGTLNSAAMGLTGGEVTTRELNALVCNAGGSADWSATTESARTPAVGAESASVPVVPSAPLGSRGAGFADADLWSLFCSAAGASVGCAVEPFGASAAGGVGSVGGTSTTTGSSVGDEAPVVPVAPEDSVELEATAPPVDVPVVCSSE
jgi:hypothetical protein